jgi:hypothetical protein
MCDLHRVQIHQLLMNHGQIQRRALSSAFEFTPQHRPSSYFTLEQVLAAFYAISSDGKSVTFKDLKQQLELGFVESEFERVLIVAVGQRIVLEMGWKT